MKNNPIFQVLVVSNTSELAAANHLDDLAVGQLGLFNAETNVSVDPNAALPDKFFFAVGLPDADGNLGDVRKSAGDYIKKALLKTVYASDPVTGSSQVTVINMTGFVPAANKDYVIRCTFMSANTMGMQGFNHPAKTWVVTTGATAPNLAAFLDLCVAEINKDDEAVVVATENGSTTLTLTFGVDPKVATLGGLNPKYHFLRKIKGTVSLSGDWTPASVTSITTTDPVYDEGLGYDIQQMEYDAGGWNGNPGVYRDSKLTGLIGHTTDTFAVETTKYWTMRLNYELESHSGGNLPYSNQLETVIAIPNVYAYETLIAKLVDMINGHNVTSGSVAHVTLVTTTTTTGS